MEEDARLNALLENKHQQEAALSTDSPAPSAALAAAAGAAQCVCCRTQFHPRCLGLDVSVQLPIRPYLPCPVSKWEEFAFRPSMPTPCRMAVHPPAMLQLNASTIVKTCHDLTWQHMGRRA